MVVVQGYGENMKEVDLAETGYFDYLLREDGSLQDPGRVNEEIPVEFTPEVLEEMRQAFINEYVMGGKI